MFANITQQAQQHVPLTHPGLGSPKLVSNTFIDNLEKTKNIVDLKIEKAMDFSLGEIIARYASDENLSLKEATIRMTELFRFLVLCSSKKDGCYGMKGPIDKAWHSFLMFTKKYQIFCNDVLGNFIHHRPNTQIGDEKDAANGYRVFLHDYKLVFGIDANEKYWPRSNINAIDCDDCVECGHDCLTS